MFLLDSVVNVLLIDDDLVDILFIQRAFDRSNRKINLYTANDGIEALSLLRMETEIFIPKPDLILLDVNMPRMNGIEFLKRLREDENLKNISVVVRTTSNTEEDIASVNKHNIAGYIVKSLDMHNSNSELMELWKYLSCDNPNNL